MKKIVIAMVAIIAFAGSAFAATDVLEFNAKNGKVTFNHKLHQEKVKGDCKTCHEKAPGKIEGFGKDYAHKTCKGCHEKSGGPMKCGECHKK